MCIIVMKPKGSDFPSEQVIRNCMDKNPDGFSMAWNTPDGKVKNFQSMDKDNTILVYRAVVSTMDPAVTGFIFHARWATHGSKDVKNCHCWIGETPMGPMAFAHNGVLTNIAVHDDLTDSECFFRDIFVPVACGSGLKVAGKVARAIIGTSRFAFLLKDGDVNLMGEFIKDTEPGHKGCCYFSNAGYRSYSSVFSSGYASSLGGSREPIGNYGSRYKARGDRNQVVIRNAETGESKLTKLSDVKTKTNPKSGFTPNLFSGFAGK